MTFFDELVGMFSGYKAVTCPSCMQISMLRTQDKNCKTEGCGREIPLLYRQEHRNLKPLFVPMIGWTNAGKTMSLLSMMLTLDNIALIWDGFLRDYGSQETMDWIRGVRGDLLDKGTLPSQTHKEVQPAYIMLLRNLPYWRYVNGTGRTLVIRDFGGELFHDLTIPQDQMYFIKDAPTLVMMFCLSDLEGRNTNKDHYAIDELLQSYIYTLTHQGLDLKEHRRNLICVLTQGDKLIQQNLLPENLARYLMDDPIAAAMALGQRNPWSGEQMGQYMEQLNNASDAIGEWLASRFPHALTLIHRANAYSMRLRFCLTSATGRPLTQESNKLVGQPTPKRILDPLFHALQFEAE